MTLTDRREFLKRAGYSVAGLTALSGPLQGIFARGALAVGSTGVAPDNGGYGPLRAVSPATESPALLRNSRRSVRTIKPSPGIELRAA